MGSRSGTPPPTSSTSACAASAEPIERPPRRGQGAPQRGGARERPRQPVEALHRVQVVRGGQQRHARPAAAQAGEALGEDARRAPVDPLKPAPAEAPHADERVAAVLGRGEHRLGAPESAARALRRGGSQMRGVGPHRERAGRPLRERAAEGGLDPAPEAAAGLQRARQAAQRAGQARAGTERIAPLDAHPPAAAGESAHPAQRVEKEGAVQGERGRGPQPPRQAGLDPPRGGAAGQERYRRRRGGAARAAGRATMAAGGHGRRRRRAFARRGTR